MGGGDTRASGGDPPAAAARRGPSVARPRGEPAPVIAAAAAGRASAVPAWQVRLEGSRGGASSRGCRLAGEGVPGDPGPFPPGGL